jgi:uncharacterized protein (TIGR02145 family)
MTTKMERLNKWLLTILLVFAPTLQAQVTIGGDTPPQEFSILEILSNGKRGLRLPQLTAGQRQALEDSDAFKAQMTGKAKGLTIFNITNNCMETWNGKEWISMCAYPIFDLIHNVNPGSTKLNTAGAFVNGSGDDKTRGTGVAHSSMPAGVFHYTDGSGQKYPGLDYTHISGVKVTIPATTLAIGDGELAVNVEGTVSPAYAGKAFDIPVTLYGQTLYVRVSSGCGAYTSENRTIPSVDGDPNWLQFQCYNLGTDTSLDPFTPNRALFGNYYQWGQNDTNWLSSRYGDNTAWGDGTYGESATTNPARGPKDPCPTGWKIPSQSQWASIFRGGTIRDEYYTATANTWTPKGTFSTTTSTTGGGYMVGNSLFLPAAGYRVGVSIYDHVGNHGAYWSSTLYSSSTKGSAYLLFFTSSIDTANSIDRYYGRTVRCVAE